MKKGKKKKKTEGRSDEQGTQQLTSIVQSLLDSLMKDTEEDEQETPLLLQRILLPLSCLTGFIKTIVGELQERENRCIQKAKFR